MKKVVITVETLVDNHACEKLSNSEWLRYPKTNIKDKVEYLEKLGVMTSEDITENNILKYEFLECHV